MEKNPVSEEFWHEYIQGEGMKKLLKSIVNLTGSQLKCVYHGLLQIICFNSEAFS